MAYKTPGVYIREVTFGAPVGTGIGTSSVFIGQAKRGKANKYEVIYSWEQFKTLYGDLDKDSLLTYAVENYFKIAASPIYVIRVANGATAAKIEGTITGQFDVSARSEGAWGNGLELVVSESVNADKRTYEVVLDGETVEVFKDKTNQEFASVVSNYIEVKKLSDTPPATGTYTFSGGSDGNPLTASDYISDAIKNELRKIKAATQTICLTDIYLNSNLIPDTTFSGLTDADIRTIIDDYISFIEKEEFAWLLVVNVPFGKTVTDKITFKQGLVNEDSSAYKMYSEFVKIYDRRTKDTVFIPVSTTIPALNVVAESREGIWRSVAGNIYGVIPTAIDVDVELTDVEAGALYEKNINPTLKKTGVGIVVWGDRTGSTDVDYKYGNVRRLMTFIEKSIKTYLDNKVFSVNDKNTWATITNDISSFLRELWRMGAIAGERETDAFFVKCDGELNTQYEIDNGILKVQVGVAAQKPAEFIVLEISASIRR